MSRRLVLLCAFVLSSFCATAREASAQAAPTTVTILRRTAVLTAPSAVSPAIAYLNPSTFEVTRVRVSGDFVQLLLRDIDRRRQSSGYGYIATADLAVDSATTDAVRAQTDTAARARAATVSPARPAAAATPASVPAQATQPQPTQPQAAQTAQQQPVLAQSARTQSAPTRSGSYPLETAAGLRPHNVTVEPTTHQGKRGVRVAISDDARRRFEQTPAGQQFEELAVVEGTDFTNGVIEAEIAGAPGQSSGEGARGFVGIAFRLQPDLKTYDAFYLRPTNGRADDQERRNHSAQYISHPAWTWNRLRQETPGRYEAYVDLVPDAWTPIRIEVRGSKAKLFVNGATQPTLIVNDVKSGEQGRGAIALWIDPGTVAHFRNLRVSP